jgi:hypothetical protein
VITLFVSDSREANPTETVLYEDRIFVDELEVLGRTAHEVSINQDGDLVYEGFAAIPDFGPWFDKPAAFPFEHCVECGLPIPGIRAPKEHPEISGSLICRACAYLAGFPTAADLGIGRKA